MVPKSEPTFTDRDARLISLGELIGQCALLLFFVALGVVAFMLVADGA